MSYYKSLQQVYESEHNFAIGGHRYRHIGQLKINKISCKHNKELEAEQEFRAFFSKEATAAKWGRYHLKFQVDFRPTP